MHVGHLLTRAAVRWPDRPAWIEPDATITFQEAEARVNRLAHALAALGARRGERVAMLVPNCHEGLETMLAPMKAGMAVVPMNARLHPDEHAYMIRNADAAVLVYGEEFRDHLAGVRDQLTSVRRFVCIGRGAPGDLAFEEVMAGQLDTPPDVAIDPADVAWLFYTSGTTGRPKGAMLTHRSLLAMVQAMLLDIDPAQPGDVLLHAAAITHGSGAAMFHQIARGGANAFPATKSFDPPKIFAAIERHRVTTMFLVPTMIHLLAESPDRSRYDLSSLHTVFYGGAPMYVEQLHAALRAFGPIFVQLFGQGEAPMACTSLPKAEHVTGDDPVKLRRLASAGRETTAMHVRVVDDEDRTVPRGTMGEIVARGDLVMKGYWADPEATAATLRNGWLHTGDIGFMDDDGYVFITDRKKDMIISGGSNIYPREVEEVICRHPAVFEVAVIGVPDVKWGETVKAVVVPRPDARLTEADIVDHCRQHLASYKKPQSVEFIDALPKNAYGKILKRELRQRYWQGRTRTV
jgi:acyl-CoA synthetase (AMP-forming)/AMP-acid ligase II